MSEQKKQKRHWPKYNEALVQRGEILLSLDCLRGWQQELVRRIKARTATPSTTPIA